MNAYLVSHNGMGDNLYMIGALHFLLNFYEKIYFLCKNKYYDNVTLFFIDTPNIICVPFDENNETAEIKRIINANYQMNDVFVCGECHKPHVQSKITNPNFLTHTRINKNYTIDFDTLTTRNYNFIENFYKDIKLNLTHFYDYFHLPTTNESIELYNQVKAYYIVFIQLKASDGRCLNIFNLLKRYLFNPKVILICNDINLYDVLPQHKTADIEKKHKLCQAFVHNKLVHYKEVVQNSNEIYIIDSCFIGMVLPYLKTRKLKANKVRIIKRDIAKTVIL
jgi:hypothetical protein